MENTAKASSCLAIAEKKTQRPGGCIGIFFQLFDWNRRLAKKKLFSRKLLPPARTNQAAKKFKGSEKMPASKIHLIADENRGGFPCVKKKGNHITDIERKNEMRVPGLVARLMGLDSMPIVNREKPRKPYFSDPCDNGGENFVEDLNLEKSTAKAEARPLKLQKTGPSERKMMSRIGSEVMQYKNVLSRSRKHHHTSKLASQVKSPRLPSGKNAARASRLIDVATRILEPGLQASNKSKYVLTNPNSVRCSTNEALSREIRNVPSVGFDSSKSFMEYASCGSCGNFLKVEVLNHNVEDQRYAITPLNSNFAGVSSEGSVSQKGEDEVLQKNYDQTKSFSFKHNESKDCPISNGDFNTERLALNNESPSQQFKFRKNESFPVFKYPNQSEDHMPSVRDRMPPRSKFSNIQSRRITSSANAVNGTKNFVALNRNLNGCSREKLPTNVEIFKFGMEKKSFSGRENLPSQSKTSPRKRRTANVVSSRQIEIKNSVVSPVAKHQISQHDTFSRTSSRLERKSLTTKQSCAKSRLAGYMEGERLCKRDNDIVSFSIRSPIRQKNRVASAMDDSLVSEKKISQKPSLFGADAIGILEQKLKELTCQENDDLASGSPSKRSTARVLQELISALAAEQQVSFEGSTFNSEEDVKRERVVRMGKGGDHLSPGSVLEASFSSSSVDDSSGYQMPAYSIDYSNDQLQLSEPDTDLLDSAASWSKGKAGNRTVTDLFSAISRMLQSYNLTGIGLTGSKLSHAKEVLLNTEILFNTGGNKLLIVPLFIDELENFTCEMWTNFSDLKGSDEGKDVNHLRGFLFDCLIEYLDSKYSHCNPGFNGWMRTSLEQSERRVIQEVESEIKKWASFVGMMTDEIVEWEMGNSLGKWTDFGAEVSEYGADIDGDILQILVEEIVIDLWEGRGFF